MSRPKIMIVDDEFWVCMALADDLQAEGFEIVGPFSQVDKALAEIEANPPDLAFLDINLGQGQTSFEIAEKLKERGTPFVFISGYSEMASMTDRFADAVYLSKPVKLADALHQARRLTDRASDD